MRWNGIACHVGTASISPTLTNAKAGHATSGQWSRQVERVAHISQGLDRAAAQLAPETAHVDVDDVGAGIERAVPRSREQLLARADRARAPHQVREQVELAPGERHAPAVH